MFPDDRLPLTDGFTSSERGMYNPPVAQRHFPWQAMLAAGLFVSGICVGYAAALLQHTHESVLLVEKRVLLYGGKEERTDRSGTGEGDTAEGGAVEGGAAEGIETADGTEAASGCCGPCSSAAAT